MVARYNEFCGHKACENDSASNPGLTTKFEGFWPSLVNQIKTSLNAIEYHRIQPTKPVFTLEHQIIKPTKLVNRTAQN